MGNCLVTKLLSDVNNPLLCKTDEFLIKVTSTNAISNNVQQKIVMFYLTTGKVTVIGNGVVSTTYEGLVNNPQTELTMNEHTTEFYVSNSDCYLKVSNKYELKFLGLCPWSSLSSICSVDMSDLAYSNLIDGLIINSYETKGVWSVKHMPALTEILSKKANNSKLNLEDVSELNNLTLLEFVGNVYGNLYSLHSLAKLEDVTLNSNNIEGTVQSLNYTKLNTLIIKGKKVDVPASAIIGTLLVFIDVDGCNTSGSIEDFVSAQISNGRTTCDGVSINKALKLFSFGGQKYQDDNYCVVTWQSINKIIIYSPNSIEYATVVYAKGATAEEIAAWEQAGKTVVQIS